MRRPPLALGAILLAAAAISFVAATASPGPALPAPGGTHGGFEVLALAGASWQHVADLRFGERYAEETAVLPAAALAEPSVRVRLVEHGGGAAHVDRIALGEDAPFRLEGAGEPDALGLALRVDNDVLDAFGKTIDLTFPKARPGAALRLNARVEAPVLVGSPFAFPPVNQFRPLGPGSAFYRYRPDAVGRVPGWPSTLDASKALFAERTVPTTGHPEGTTLGWVANDRDTLYAALDFTPDNTRDGDKDWASVAVATTDGVREFRVSEGETRWGVPSFGPTPRAPWRHKLYRFAIPLAELGIRDAASAGELRLAFSAYGTAAVLWLSPTSWDFGPVRVGSMSSRVTFTVTNPITPGPGAPSMALGTPWFTPGNPSSSPFVVDPGTCGDGVVLAPAASCTFRVAFAPSSKGAAADVLTLAASIGGGPTTTAPLALAGNGLDPTIPALGRFGLALLGLALGAAGLLVLRRA